MSTPPPSNQQAARNPTDLGAGSNPAGDFVARPVPSRRATLSSIQAGIAAGGAGLALMDSRTHVRARFARAERVVWAWVRALIGAIAPIDAIAPIGAI